MSYRQWIVALFVGVCGLFVLQSTALAQDGGDYPSNEGMSIGAFIGYDIDILEEAFIGLDARFGFDLPDVAPGFGIVVNPALNYYLISGGTFLQADGNVLAQYKLANEAALYGGIGLALFIASDDFGTETDLNFNTLILGGSYPFSDDFRGFGQLRLTRFGGDFFSFTTMGVMVGASFGM